MRLKGEDVLSAIAVDEYEDGGKVLRDEELGAALRIAAEAIRKTLLSEASLLNLC